MCRKKAKTRKHTFAYTKKHRRINQETIKLVITRGQGSLRGAEKS